MKKRIAFVMAVFVFCLALFVSSAELPSVTVTLDGEAIDCAFYGQEATIVENRTLVPLRAIFEAIGASVEWDAQNYVVTSTLDETTVKLRIGENFLIRNGQAIQLDVPAMLMNDRTMIPVRAVSEAFGIKVDWIDETRTVVLLTGGYRRGIRSDKVYYGDWLNFNYTLPEGCTFTNDTSLLEQMGVVSISDNDIDFSSLSYVYEFEVTDENGNVLSVACEKNDADMTADEYLKDAVKVYELSGLDARISGIYETVIGVAVDTEVNYLGVNLTQRIVAYEKDGRIVSFIFTYTDISGLSRLESGFGEYVKPSQIPEFDEIYEEQPTKSGDEPEVNNAEKHHAYGKLYLGMTKSEAKNAVKGEAVEKNGGAVVNIFDENNAYDDEDESITSDANCDLISLTFDEGVLEHVYVSTEYMTLNAAKRILEGIISYYGEPDYVFETDEGFYDTYFWSDGNVCRDCTIVYRENYGYSCIIEIYMVE